MDKTFDSTRMAYQKPAVERFGSFRELTKIGPSQGNDIGSVFGLDAGCNPNTTDPDFACPTRS